VCCAEKGIFRFHITAHGTAGHASMPSTGDNALLKLGPPLQRLAAAGPSFELTEAPALLLRGLGEDPQRPEQALKSIAETAPELVTFFEPMLGVTLAPTMAQASQAMNVIPSRATIGVDCRVPPGLGEEAARRRIDEVLGDLTGTGLEITFTEQVVGNSSPAQTDLMATIDRWIKTADPGAETVPLILPGFSDSRWFREAFPQCVAYGFFPQRHQPMLHSAPLVHNANERIDVRDLGFAARFYADLATELLGGSAAGSPA
jgi:acetylornithine deacetylase/succinyl-diaminopimelate desuccinylase-like protein